MGKNLKVDDGFRTSYKTNFWPDFSKNIFNINCSEAQFSLTVTLLLQSKEKRHLELNIFNYPIEVMFCVFSDQNMTKLLPTHPLITSSTVDLELTSNRLDTRY